MGGSDGKIFGPNIFSSGPISLSQQAFYHMTIFSSFKMFTFALLSSRNRWILREKEDVMSGSYSGVTLASFHSDGITPVKIVRLSYLNK